MKITTSDRPYRCRKTQDHNVASVGGIMIGTRQMSLNDIQDEVRAMVARGRIGRQQRVYELSKFFNDGEWPTVERLLESHEYLLKDYVIDLIGTESWLND